jgi:hypothetical protein
VTSLQMGDHLRRRMRAWRVISVICFVLIVPIGVWGDAPHDLNLAVAGGFLTGVALTCLALSDSLQGLLEGWA